MSNDVEVLREWRESAPFWEKHASTIRTMFAPLTRALIEQAGISEGQKVLDVAGGPGEPSLTIAQTVGPTGFVTCTDAISEMVTAAKTEARRRGLRNIEFHQCAVDSLPFDNNSFDATVSRLGAMFFPDPPVALREMLRVVRPMGVLALAVWGKGDLNPFTNVANKVVARYFELPAADANAPGAFRFAESGLLASVMKAAGGADVNERVIDFRIEAPISPAQFWQLRSETSGTLRENLARLTEEQRARLSHEVQEAASEFFPDDRMSFPAQTIIVTGTKA
jgi:SAM-dependent methyltransferase